MCTNRLLPLLVLLLAPLAHADAASDWIGKFQFLPLEAGEDAPFALPSTALPEFEVTAEKPGMQLVRISLPFAPRAWLESEGLGIESPSGRPTRSLRPTVLGSP